MYKAGDLKKGIKLEIDNEPYVIEDFEFSKPGKGQALYRCRMRNMISGNRFDRTYRSGDVFKPAALDERRMTYLFTDGHSYTVMDQESFEQYQLSEEQIGDAKHYLIDNLEIDVLLFQDRPIGVSLPNFVVLKIVRADPAARGDTATNVTKTAVVETGFELQVPAFVAEGEKIQIDTRTGSYVTRVK